MTGSIWSAIITAVIKVIDTDYTKYAVLYRCDHVLVGGDCDVNNEHVFVLTRHVHQALDKISTRKVHQLIRSICFEPGDLPATQHTGALLTCAHQHLHAVAQRYF